MTVIAKFFEDGRAISGLVDVVTPRPVEPDDRRLLQIARDVGGMAATIAPAGHLVSDEHTPECWTLVDAEGNEAYLATLDGSRPGTSRNGHSLDQRVVTTG